MHLMHHISWKIKTQDQYWQAKKKKYIYIYTEIICPSLFPNTRTNPTSYVPIGMQSVTCKTFSYSCTIHQPLSKRSLSSFVTCLNALQCVDSEYDFYGIFTFNHLNFNEQTLLKANELQLNWHFILPYWVCVTWKLA